MLVESAFLLALALTLAIEVPAVFLIFRYLVGFKEARFKEIGPIRVLFVAGLASCLTLPYLWFILPPYVDARLYLIIGEALVVLVEAIVYNRLLGLDILRSGLVSTAANMLSFLTGLLL